MCSGFARRNVTFWPRLFGPQMGFKEPGLRVRLPMISCRTGRGVDVDFSLIISTVVLATAFVAIVSVSAPRNEFVRLVVYLGAILSTGLATLAMYTLGWNWALGIMGVVVLAAAVSLAKLVGD